ncbi:MAG: class I SAM-dependent rRNA methyltransferase [Deltaproteobacteria bacterium]|nr:class I SAM-dependent rRNA methyltransferase [Deltaproteobacteria bacterium]
MRARHPWIFSGAVAREPEAEPGAIVDVIGHDGEFLARGTYNPDSQIRVRVFTFEQEPIDAAFLTRRLTEARRWRRALLPENTDCFRVCFSEGDSLPGLIVDEYAGYAVIQILTAGAEALRGPIVDAVTAAIGPRGIYERSESAFRADEGLEKRHGVLAGEEPPPELAVTENGMRLIADIAHGQKTGLFLDQRDARKLAYKIADGRTVLNAFSYSGGFGAAAMIGGATRVVNVDSSARALELGRRTYEANGLAVDDADFLDADVFDFLREDGDAFGFVILDPPAFAKSQAGVSRALRGYKEIIMQGLRRLEPGGFLMAFSCSGHVDTALFQKSFSARRSTCAARRRSCCASATRSTIR